MVPGGWYKRGLRDSGDNVTAKGYHGKQDKRNMRELQERKMRAGANHILRVRSKGRKNAEREQERKKEQRLKGNRQLCIEN